MYTLIILLVILASILMIGIVLIQESKGGGLASSFSSSNQIMGVRKTTDFLEKATWGLAIAMVVLSIVSISFAKGAHTENAPITESSVTTTTTPQAPTGVPTNQNSTTPAQPEK